MKEPIIIYKKVMNFGKSVNGKKQKAISIPIELRDLIEKDKVYKITIEEL